MVNGKFVDKKYNMGHYVSEAHLKAITSLGVSGSSGGDLSLGGNWFGLQGNITELKPGDFDGLTNLTELRLDGNELSALPDGIFDNLRELTELKLFDNQLSALPSGVFDQLTKLTELSLSNNQLSALPDGVFAQLTDLTVLTLNNNQVSALPSGVFDQLTKLTRLYLNSNQVSALPENIFDQLTDLTLLNLFDNPLTSLQKSDFDHLTNLEVLILPGSSTSNPLPEFSGDTPVCDRTPQVRDAIVAAVPGVNNCGDVTEAHLAAITDTELELELSGSSITELKPGDFDNLTNLRGLGLVDNQLSSLPEDIFEYLINLEALAIGNTQLSSLPDGLFENLTNLTALGIANNTQLSSLPEGLFDNLTSLRIIYLNDNQLNSLPEGLFDSPTNLLILDLSGNQLSSLPEGLFDKVTLSLDLSDNQLSSLPEGLFRGIFDEIPDFTGFTVFGSSLGPIPRDTYNELANPTTLDLTNNPAAPYSCTVSLKKVGDGQFKAIVPTGAPFEIALPLTFTNGSISSGADTITIPAGRAESDTLTVTRVPGTTFAVTVNFGTLPEMPARHEGYALVKSANLPLIFTEFGGMISVCDRTPQVRNAILGVVRDVIWGGTGISECSAVTEAHLAAITRLDLDRGGYYSRHISITGLQRGDFDGLTNLRTLYLSNNQFSALPDGLFDHLTNLTVVTLNNNQLSSLPAGLLDNLTNLPVIHLNDNQLSSLPDGLFDNLTKVTEIHLDDNQLSSLPDGLFDNLTKVTEIYLHNNQLGLLPAGLFDNLTALERLGLFNNRLRVLPDGLFDSLTNLPAIHLNDNQLSSLPDGLFDNLTKLEEIYLHNNQLSSLPAGLFGNLTNLIGVGLHNNRLSSLPPGLFGNLTNTTFFDLSGNLINPLPLTVSLEKVAESQFRAVAPAGAPVELVLPVSVSGPGAIAGGATTITIPIGSVESAPLTMARTAGTTDAVNVDIGTLPGLAGHGGLALVKSGDLPLAYYVGAEGRQGAEGRPGGQVSTDFNGDGQTDFVDFFQFIDAFGGSDPKFDLDGSGTVDFVDFFRFVDAFGSSSQAKLVAMAQEMLGLPAGTELQQNAPNPFNSETVISWFLLEPGPARLEVFSLTGQRVAVLHRGRQQAGYYRLHWDGRDDEGRPLGSGVYLYRLVTGESVMTRKLTLLR